MPPEQICPAAQARPHMPQWPLSVARSRQVPEQLVVPAPQETTQAPMEQTWPAAQAVPQAPQWLMSVCRSRQTPEHSVWPARHETTQRPAAHA